MLTAMIEKAAADNLDLRIALSRVNEARSRVGIATYTWLSTRSTRESSSGGRYWTVCVTRVRPRAASQTSSTGSSQSGKLIPMPTAYAPPGLSARAICSK